MELARVAHLALTTVHCGGLTIALLANVLLLLGGDYLTVALFNGAVAFLALLLNLLVGTLLASPRTPKPWIGRMRNYALLALPTFALYLSALYTGMAIAMLLGLATFGLLFASFLSGLEKV